MAIIYINILITRVNLKAFIYIFRNLVYMVGRVGYAPTTPAMSMQYSTIELTALIF